MSKRVNAEVKVRKGESVEKAMRKLKKILKKSGLFDELKERRYYEKPSVKRRKKKVQRQRLIDKQNKLRKLEEERLYKPKPKRKKRRDR